MNNKKKDVEQEVQIIRLALLYKLGERRKRT